MTTVKASSVKKTAITKSAITKSAMVRKLLTRPRGATVPEVMTATGWQNHSVRAFLTGLRKQGLGLVREERTSGDLAYRLVEAAPADRAAPVDQAAPVEQAAA